MAENVYYKDNIIKITDDWAIFGQRVYNITDISSVSYEINPADKTPTWVGITRCSFTLGLVGVAILLAKWFLTPDYDAFMGALLEVSIIFFALLSLMTIGILPLMAPARYLVTIEGTFGKADILLAKHWDYAYKVALFLNRAIKANRRKATKRQLAQGHLK